MIILIYACIVRMHFIEDFAPMFRGDYYVYLYVVLEQYWLLRLKSLQVLLFLFF